MRPMGQGKVNAAYRRSVEQVFNVSVASWWRSLDYQRLVKRFGSDRRHSSAISSDSRDYPKAHVVSYLNYLEKETKKDKKCHRKTVENQDTVILFD